MLGLAAAPAAAHVTANTSEANAGSFARVDFRVPNESDTESTTELEVHFPADTPIPSVSVGQVPGWTAEITRRTLDEPMEGGHGESIAEVVEFITWTIDDPDAAIGPGEFLEFPVSMGPLPEADELFFRALQTYSDGAVVRWIELPEGDAELAFPAPSIELTAGAGTGEEPAPAGESAGDDPATGDDQAAPDTGSSAGVWLGLAGLIAGLAGLAAGGLALLRTRG
jgi:uncharacterized protein YcnI